MQLKKLILISTLGLFLNTHAFATETVSKDYKNLKKTQSQTTPNEVLEKLREGNARYVAGEKVAHNFRSQAKFAAKKGQYPLAFILNCIDSRSIPQVIFNKSAGSIFVGRVAGNVLSKNMIASMEFAAHVGTKLFVIMGHTHCGAMGAACVGEAFGNVNHLIAEIKPAVSMVEKNNELLCKDPALIDKIAKANVKNMTKVLLKESPYIAKLVASGKVKIVGAMHNIKSGKVEFY